MTIEIRREEPADEEQITAVIEQAFRDAAHASHTEQFVVMALRESEGLTLSLVADIEGSVVGHLAVSEVSISDGARHWYGLGPVSVLPLYQGQGIGSALMEHALDTLKAMGATGCVVLGDPNYYHRFGFRVVEGLRFSGAPAEYFQALAFDGEYPRGEVRYHRAFYDHV